MVFYEQETELNTRDTITINPCKNNVTLAYKNTQQNQSYEQGQRKVFLRERKGRKLLQQ